MATLVSRPNSAPFWNAYLNYTHIPANQNSKVWDTIGGSIGESYGPVAENSCAARVSYGLDYGNSPIVQFPAASVNLPDHVYMGKKGDGMRYIVSAMQMAAYLKMVWGNPDRSLRTAKDVGDLIRGLKNGQCAIFATSLPPGGHGHSGVLKAGYTDPFVETELPVDAWILP